MSSVSKEQIEKVKQMDLLAYLSQYEPDELISNGRNEFTTKTHGSLVISNGKWIWNKHNIGGRTALDYLIKVRGMGFVDAVEHLCQRYPGIHLPAGDVRAYPMIEVPAEKPFILPERHSRTTKPILPEAFVKLSQAT